MPDLDLQEAALDRALRHTNFFNGRVLTARDLQDEQAAGHAHRRYLGQAIGDGVVHGLHVTRDTTTTQSVVDVTAGLAINREGGILSLSENVSVRLVPTPDEGSRESGLFVVCTPQPPSATLSDIGAYLLVVGPATGYEERVPLVGLTDGGVAGGCGDRFLVEGVQFRLVRLTLDPDDTSQTARRIRRLVSFTNLGATQQSQLRNLLAHYCLGTETLQSFPQDPRDRFTAYGAIDGLREAGVLNDCEVPLALVHWTDAGLQFVDAWAVRRRTAPPTGSLRWPLHVNPRRIAEAEAAFLQFQDQIDALDGTPDLRAFSHFHVLPSAGYVPTEQDNFFDDLEIRELDLDEAFLRSVLIESFFTAPIDLDNPPPLYLYRIAGAPLVLFARRSETRLIEVGVPPQTDDETEPGRVTVRVAVPESDRDATAGRNQNVLGTLLLRHLAARGKRPPFQESDVLKAIREVLPVEARHAETGVSYPARPMLDERTGRGDSIPGTKASQQGLDTLRFRTDATLPAGHYRITLTSPFGTQDTLRTLGEGEHLTIDFSLVTREPGLRPSKPSATIPAEWMRPAWYEEVHIPENIVDRFADWPWHEAERPGFRPQPDPLPPDIANEFVRWGDEIRRQYPDAPIDPGDVRIYVAEDYTPDGPTPAEPYAYVVFGEGGTAVPLLLTPTHRTLGRDASLDQSELVGGSVQRRLYDLGIDRLDVLAAGWGGLVEEAAAVPLGVAGELLASTRAEVETLHDGLGRIGGIDRGLRTDLSEVGIRTTVDLANASPDGLVAALGERERAIGLPRARLLVEEARSAVDPAFWSLGAAETNFSPTDVQALTERDIVSLGDLQRATVSDEGRAEIEDALGASSAAIETASSQAETTLGGAAETLRLRRAERTPVSNVAEVDTSTALELGRLGVANQRDLAAANPESIAGAFGGDAGAAQSAINAVRSRLNLP